MKRLIYAMSRNRQDVAADIEQGCRELILHLIKLWFFPHSQDKYKWRKEVAEKLWYVDTFKGFHKLPSAKFILEHSWGVHKDRLSASISIIVDDYGQSTNIQGIDIMKDHIEKYFKWISKMLAARGQISYKKIYNALEDLGF